MNAKQLATLLGRRVMGNEITVNEERMAREAGLVVVFGASDDNVELRGAIHGEVGAYNGRTVHIRRDGLVRSECENPGCPYYYRLLNNAPAFRAVWNDGPGAAWTYEVPWPHETFRVVEDDEVWCVGVVFHVDDIPERKEKTQRARR